jgi:hypothetical protein
MKRRSTYIAAILATVASMALAFVAAPSLAAAAGSVYWSDNNQINRAALSGAGGAVLPVAGGTLGGPAGIAIDSATGRIYWVNYLGGVSYANLDGSGGGDLNVAPVARNHSLAPALQKAPAAVSAPSVSGGSTVGATLSCSQGGWAADLPGSTLYRARRTPRAVPEATVTRSPTRQSA